MVHEFTCSQCGQHKIHENKDGFGSTGYGVDKNDNKICFECCGKNDIDTLYNLKGKEKMCLYLDTEKKVITNWPGTLKINVGYIRTGKHNIAGKRYDTWFTLERYNYHAVQFGDNTQICHVKKVA